MNRLPVCPDPVDASLDEELGALFRRIDYEKAPPQTNANPQKLEGMRHLIRALALQSPRYQIVHVAGTKGKGTVGRQIALALQHAGKRVGRYSSPHIETLNERIEINGNPIGNAALANALRDVRIASQIEEAAGEAPHSFFEIVTAAALLHFHVVDCDFVVLEVGLGGRLDSTNVCQPTVSVITNISIDHTRQLGDTVALIAAEKAGIIKPGIPVISGATHPDAAAVIQRVCRDQGSPLAELQREFACSELAVQPDSLTTRFSVGTCPTVDRESASATWSLRELETTGLGQHVTANAALVAATLRTLDPTADWISDMAIRMAVRAAPLPGRFEVVSRSPAVVLDMAHNEASIAGMIDSLDHLMTHSGKGKWRLVFSVSKDKERRKLLDALVERFDEVHLTQFVTNPRAVPIEELEVTAREAVRASGRAVDVFVWPEPRVAWEAALQRSCPNDLVCVAGSAFLIGEVRPLARQAMAIGDVRS